MCDEGGGGEGESLHSLLTGPGCFCVGVRCRRVSLGLCVQFVVVYRKVNLRCL